MPGQGSIYCLVTTEEAVCQGQARTGLPPLKVELALGACLGMKNIGKPCAGEPHARFDEGGQARACPLLYPLTKIVHRESIK